MWILQYIRENPLHPRNPRIQRSERAESRAQPFRSDRCHTEREIMRHVKMPTYDQNPALRPTILIQAIKQDVYRASRELPPARPDATEDRVARETPRAA